MLTIQQAQEYLAAQGIDLPAFVVVALLDGFEDLLDCLEANYPDGTVMLIQLYLLQLLALAQMGRNISSQTAPSGASRSFRYNSLGDQWRATLSLLRSLDKAGCTNDLVPEDPFPVAHAGMWIAPNRRGCK